MWKEGAPSGAVIGEPFQRRVVRPVCRSGSDRRDLAGLASDRVCLFHARGQCAAPRLFARNTSRTVSAFFLFFLALPLVLVPLKFLAYRLAGPQITAWHWLIAYGPVPVMALWLAARLRRKRTDYF